MAIPHNIFVLFRAQAFSSIGIDELAELVLVPMNPDADIVVLSLWELAELRPVFSLPHETCDHFEASMGVVAQSHQNVRRYHIAIGLAMLEIVLAKCEVYPYGVPDIAGLIVVAAASHPREAAGLSSVLLSRAGDCEDSSGTAAIYAAAKVIEATVERVLKSSDVEEAIAVAESFLQDHKEDMLPSGVRFWTIAINSMRRMLAT